MIEKTKKLNKVIRNIVFLIKKSFKSLKTFKNKQLIFLVNSFPPQLRSHCFLTTSFVAFKQQNFQLLLKLVLPSPLFIILNRRFKSSSAPSQPRSHSFLFSDNAQRSSQRRFRTVKVGTTESFLARPSCSALSEFCLR